MITTNSYLFFNPFTKNAVIALAFILGYVSASPGPSQFERRVYVYERIPQAERLISRYGPGGLENEWRAIVRTDVISEEQAMRERQDLMPTMNVSISRPIKSRPVNVAQQVVDSRQLPSDQVQAHNRQGDFFFFFNKLLLKKKNRIERDYFI